MNITKTIIGILTILGLAGTGLYLSDGTKITEKELNQICEIRIGKIENIKAKSVVDDRGELLYQFDTREIVDIKINGQDFIKK